MHQGQLWARSIAAALFMTLAATVAMGTVVAQDDFEDYTIGTQLGDGSGTGGAGWSSIWGNNSGGTSLNDMYVRDGAGYGTTSNVVVIDESGGSSSWLSRSIDAGTFGDIAGGTVYISFQGQNLNNGNRQFGMLLMQGGSEKFRIGQLNGGTNTWTMWNVDNGSGGSMTVDSGVSTTTAALLVLKIDLNGVGGGDAVTFWVNPDISAGEGANTAVGGQSYQTLSGTDLDLLTAVRIGTNGDSLPQVHVNGWIDNVRITTTWAEINPLHPGDANGDGMVNLADLQILGDNWQSTIATWAEADFTGDGNVNLADLQILGDNWGYGVSSDLSFDQALAGGAIPEPTCICLFGLAGALLRGRR